MLLLIPIVIYSLLFLPFLGLLPFHDGVNQFLGSYSLYSGTYFTHMNYFHPPFPLIVSSIIMSIFGLYSFSFYGYIFGLAGIVGIYLLAEKLFNKKVALLSAIFLATSGLYISVGLFGLEDFIMTTLILLALAGYVRNNLILYSVAASFAVLTKETAILLPICILIVEIKNKKFLLYNIIPLMSFGGWVFFSHIIGHGLWNEWNFSETASKGPFYTIAYNLLTIHFLNKYAYQNWLHLFVMNFNWIIWVVAITGLKFVKVKKPILSIAIFCFTFTIAILSFQTYTITRYVLPVISLVYVFTAYTINRMRNPWQTISIVVIFIIVGISLFTSVDPISNLIWNKRYQFGLPFYSGPFDGGDAITYNMEYMFISKKRNDIIFSNTCSQYPNEDLHLLPELFQDFHITNCLNER